MIILLKKKKGMKRINSRIENHASLREDNFH